MNAMTSIVAAMPADGIFDVGTDVAGDMKSFLLTAAAAGIGFIVLKFVFTAKTFVAALIALVMGMVLFWVLGNVENPAIQRPLDDTINEYGLSSPAPDLLFES